MEVIGIVENETGKENYNLNDFDFNKKEFNPLDYWLFNKKSIGNSAANKESIISNNENRLMFMNQTFSTMNMTMNKELNRNINLNKQSQQQIIKELINEDEKKEEKMKIDLKKEEKNYEGVSIEYLVNDLLELVELYEEKRGEYDDIEYKRIVKEKTDLIKKETDLLSEDRRNLSVSLSLIEDEISKCDSMLKLSNTQVDDRINEMIHKRNEIRREIDDLRKEEVYYNRRIYEEKRKYHGFKKEIDDLNERVRKEIKEIKVIQKEIKDEE